jgi:hypothetical protein
MHQKWAVNADVMEWECRLQTGKTIGGFFLATGVELQRIGIGGSVYSFYTDSRQHDS